MQLLLNEDQLANLDNTTASASAPSKKSGKKAAQGETGDSAVRDLWNEEGDEFFGQSAAGPTGSGGSGEPADEDESQVPTPTSGRGRKRRGDGTSTRGRKPGGRGGRRKAQAPAADADS